MENKILEMMQTVIDKVDGLESKIDIELKGINNRLEGLEIKVDSIETKVDSLETKVDKIDRKMNDGFDTLEILHHETNKSIINLKVEVKKLDNRLTSQVAQNLELIQEIKSNIH